MRQPADHLGHGRGLLANRYVDTQHVRLVQDGVDGYGGFTGLAVSDDQLSLATPNRDHSVHSGDTRGERLVHGTSVHDAWCPGLKAAGLTSSIPEATLAIQRCTEGTYNSTAICIAYENISDLAWVVLTRLESLRCKFVARKALAKRTAPITWDSRFSAKPSEPSENSISSPARHASQPYTRGQYHPRLKPRYLHPRPVA